MGMSSKQGIGRRITRRRIKARKAKRQRQGIMSLKELRAEYDQLTRRLLQMSGDEFARRAKADDLPESPAVDYLRFVLGAVQKS